MSDAEQIKADIELTRAELAETVDALRTKLDVKTQAKDRLSQSRIRVAELVDGNRQVLLAAATATVLVLLLLRAHRQPQT
jgi:hypothetical protein